MTARLFGTDGIRGVANVEPMTPETLLKLGKAVARSLSVGGAAVRIVVGRDTRVSGAMLEAALAAGVAAGGGEVLLAGEIPTPAVAFLTRNSTATAGAVISASHNPFQDNGVKFFGAEGFKLSDGEESHLESMVADDRPPGSEHTGERIGRIREIDDSAEQYQRFLLGTLPQGFRLQGMRIVLDCAHGAAHAVGPQVLQHLGASLTTLGASPDGMNINLLCGALHPERLQAAVREQGADLGIALDGDADRVLLVDRHGVVVDGDEVLAILVDAAGPTACRVAVGTVMSNMGLEIALKERSVRLIRAQVGDRHVVDEMRRHGARLGGEPSGHLVLLDLHTTGDGLLAALHICRIMQATGRDLADLRRVMSKLPQALLSVRVEQRRDLRELQGLQDAISRIERRLQGRGRILVRPSGTEPLVRVMVEGEDESRVHAYAAEIADVVAREHGA